VTLRFLCGCQAKGLETGGHRQLGHDHAAAIAQRLQRAGSRVCHDRTPRRCIENNRFVGVR
jgi:hypothetical protein